MLSHSSFCTSSRRNQKGQVSLEYAAYIGLAALALAGIVVFLTIGRSGTKVSAAVSDMLYITQKTQKLYFGDPNGFTNVDAKTLITTGVIPNNMIKGNTIYSKFGTPITVAPATLYNTGDSVKFTLQVDRNLCSDFVLGAQPSFAKVLVGGTPLKDMTAGTRISAASLGMACKSGAGGGGGGVTVDFIASR